MKKNVKNKILAFSMASAMIVPNVAVVFAEAPKAGLVSVAKEVSVEGKNYLNVHVMGENAEGKQTEVEIVKIPLELTTEKDWEVVKYDVSSILKDNGWKLSSSVYGSEGVKTNTIDVTLTKEGTPTELYVERNTRNVRVHYVSESGEMIEDNIEELTIPADQTVVKAADLKKIPAGYEPVVTGDLDFYNTDDVNVELRKIEKVTTLHVNFETVDGTVVGEKTFEKTSTDEEDVVFALGDDIVLPEGYHWVDYNDQIKNVTLPAGATGGHCMFVEQDETKAVLTVTFETKDGETVGTTSVAKEFTVDENGDKVTTFVLGKDFTLPEGYHLADGVDQVTEITMPGTVGGHTVIVEKDAEPAPAPSEDPKKDDTKKEETKKEETKKASKTADTADTSDVAAYAIPLVMSMVAISAIVVGRKKLS